MKSINILMTDIMSDYVEDPRRGSRSAAVRDTTSVILKAIEAGHDWVIPEIHKHVLATKPSSRREDQKNGIAWRKAIVWIPETMLIEIERNGLPNEMRASEFLRGVVFFASLPKK